MATRETDVGGDGLGFCNGIGPWSLLWAGPCPEIGLERPMGFDDKYDGHETGGSGCRTK